MPVPHIATGAPSVVYEKREEAPFHFVSIYYVERREERGKAPTETIRRLVLSIHEALKLSYELREEFGRQGISAV